MPRSSRHGKKWIKEKVSSLITAPSKILDVGCGQGTYRNLFSDVEHVNSCKWDAVEVWEPYIKRYSLTEKYDNVLLEDVRTLDWSKFHGYDIVFLGDILEHMTKEEAQHVVNEAIAHVKWVIISIPIVYLPQGADGGNQYEIHVKPDWSDAEVMESFPNIVEKHVEDIIGAYLLKGID